MGHILVVLPMSGAKHNGSVGRALDWGSKGCKFDTHWSYCVVSLNGQDTFSTA